MRKQDPCGFYMMPFHEDVKILGRKQIDLKIHSKLKKMLKNNLFKGLSLLNKTLIRLPLSCAT